jgi:hypothetical protein
MGLDESFQVVCFSLTNAPRYEAVKDTHDKDGDNGVLQYA